ncbi:MAG: TonB C-terminal domain-containing protein [Oligoflexia bacterium]|nr:TonB C-terminal domain-containing protein [Oligoflexia bacterium]
MDETIPRRRLWFLASLLALLLHLAIFPLKIDWLRLPSPPPVEVQPIDPSRLETIREKWRKKTNPKELLLKRDSAPADAVAPDDARYFSDRNRRVEKEQRARRTAILPKSPSARARPRAAPERDRPRRSLPSVSELGLPLALSRPAPPARSEPDQEQSSGADQWVRDDRVPEGGENLLNTQQSVYYSFYARLYESIGPLWQSRLNAVYQSQRPSPGEYTTVAEVILDAEGALEDVHILRSSGIEAFDRAVIESWRRISRFPNPPRGLFEADGKVHTGWNFTVQVGSGTGLQLLPPKRAY